MINFGVKKIAYILTKPERVIVFEARRIGKILDWGDEFEFLEGIRVKLSELIK